MGIENALVKSALVTLLLPFRIFLAVIISRSGKMFLRKNPRFGLGAGGKLWGNLTDV